jgi:hypothetical protein
VIQNVLQHIGGIGVYGVISVCLFVTVFLGVLVWAAFLRKPYLHTMSRLPLDGGEISPAPTPPSALPESPHDQPKRA